MKYTDPTIHMRLALMMVALVLPATAVAQVAQEGKWPSALSRENLKNVKPAPVDLTGTWNMVIDQTNGGFRFLPLPNFKQPALEKIAMAEEYQKKGQQYRDDSGACWPLGMPAVMVRYWPIQIIQLPTLVQITSMFNNSVRWIYTDGRPHPNDNDLIETYNGHSIGRWEGTTLVVDTIGMTDDHKWIQAGVPSSTQLRVVERYSLAADGKSLDVQFTMTDPEGWEGEWVSTKRFRYEDRTDIEEHVCILEQMQRLPSYKYNVRE
jgi:hypothetical protein